MHILQEIYNNFLFLLLFIGVKLILTQINDNFNSAILENGNYELLDVTDYHNINLIVSTSKNIYTGIPPTLKTSTRAYLIKATSLITINSNFLLAACLGDAFLGKIDLTDGNFISFLSYNGLGTDSELEVPTTSCSLSNIDNTIFIGYSKIEQYPGETNKTNIIFKINIQNKNDTDNGPNIDYQIEHFTFPQSTKLTSSSRQISCEPVRIEDNTNEYRLVCLHEGIYEYFNKGKRLLENMVFATTINSYFNNFEVNMTENQIRYGLNDLGFRIYRENDTYARCVTSNALVEIHLKTTNSVTRINKPYLPTILFNFSALTDLFSYNNKFRFSVDKKSFMGKDDIYNFQINYNYYPNYFLLYDYKETSIKKILGYYNQNSNKIMLLYQTDDKIKYFTFLYKNEFFSLGEYSTLLTLGSYEQKSYDLNNLVSNPSLTDLGGLQIESFKYDRVLNTNLVFGTDFYETYMTNNIFNPDPSLNDWATYKFSFIDNVENQYTRIYHLDGVSVSIQTCQLNCFSCWESYFECTVCTDQNYAQLSDKEGECFPPTYIVENYIYDSNENVFKKCYKNCEFCSESSGTDDDQKCITCYSGLLYSYEDLGNCYPYEGLEITQEKKVSTSYYGFESARCSKYKIASTGECINSCPTSSPYCTYEYNDVSKKWEPINNKPPKYLFEKSCYEECPTNYSPDSDNNCICSNAFYKETIDENENIICLSDLNCPSEYPHQNKDTKECYESLSDCDYFFGDDCYSNVPNGKVPLSDQSEEVQNYIKEKLSLEDNLVSKIVICDVSNGVWSNINVAKSYYQECLTDCPGGYIAENISKQCVIKLTPSTNIETTIPIKASTAIPKVDTTSLPPKEETSIVTPIFSTLLSESKTENPTEEKITTIIDISTNKEIKTSNIPTTIIMKESTAIQNTEKNEENLYKSTEIINDIEPHPQPEPEPISPPIPPIGEPSNCPTKYENRCYENCPESTCLTQDDPGLKTCVRIKPNTQVFNGICFDNLESLTNNIKSFSENQNGIEAPSGIIIRGYSTNSINNNEDIDKDAKYSLVYLGDCEYKLKAYYNLSNDTELFILGIDSPSKDKSASTNVYNYAIYLADGTLLDHNEVCKESKISISSPITNPELVKLNEASYFNDLGYDIFDENSNFYTDNCAPASINGNDIVLKDRKSGFYPSGVSLCNDSCHYSQVDFNSKRFTCECDMAYNFSKAQVKTEEISEEEDVGYIEYFLSLINYKIIICYKLFLDYKSYYYNAGFYIAVGTLIFCIAQIIIFIKWGIKKMNINILENVPDNFKLQEMLKEQLKKQKEMSQKSKRKSLKENPPKKNLIEEMNLSDSGQKLKKVEKNNNDKKDKKISRKTVQLKPGNELISKRKSKDKTKATRNRKSKKINDSKIYNSSNQIQIPNSNDQLNFKKQDNITSIDSSFTHKLYYSKERDNITLKSEEKVEANEFNTLPYTQALRIDNRNCAKMFLSVIYNEIKIIRIFYYKNNFEHLSIIFSEYAFELCLDLTLNCILYTEDVISEKYNNNGSIKFFTTLSLSFMSNIISSIIAFIVSKLADYVEVFEFILKDVTDKGKYFLNMLKFKKLLCIKLSLFFILQTTINLMMCYYLMIFCTVYHKTQGSIMINYLMGIVESMAISLGLALITSLMRYLSMRYKWKYIYNTSKYFFENF